jgi:hypothetical protein
VTSNSFMHIETLTNVKVVPLVVLLIPDNIPIYSWSVMMYISLNREKAYSGQYAYDSGFLQDVLF